MNTKTASARADRLANTLADAAIAHRRGDAAKARRLYRKVLKAKPGHFKALRLSGALAHETGDLDEAIRLLSAAVRHAPPSETGALEDLGLLHLQTGEIDKAEDLLRRALAIKPASLIGLTRLGTLLLTGGRGGEAVEVLRRARELDPKDPQLAYALAHALLESREFEQSVEAADVGLSLRADDPATLLVKGVALSQLARHADAESVLARAVELAPEEISARVHLGKTRLAAGKHDAAIAVLAEAVAAAPDTPNAHAELANAYNTAGQPEAAIAACDAFLGRHPTSAAPLLVKALALRDAGRGAEADRLLGEEDLVIAETIEIPPRFDDVESFNRALERLIRGHSSLGRVHTNRATRHGIQTRSLLIDPSPEMRSFERLVDARIRALKQERKAEGHADHPWLKHAPARWLINAWGVIHGDQGHEIAHLHPDAWLSGIYFVAVADDRAGGAVELGCLPESYSAKTAPPTRRIEPRPGLLVSFPAFLPHRTVPATGPGEQVSIAFEVFAVPG